MDLSLEHWEGITAADRESAAKRLAKQLPTGFAFQAVRPYEQGSRRHHVALYTLGDAVFALIPGGEVAIGHDPEWPWEPNPDELESWQGTAEEYGIDMSLPEYIAQATLPPRRVELAPLLVETKASEVGWESVALDDPEVRELIREYGTQHPVEVCRGGTSTRICRAEDGLILAERSQSLTHGDLAARISESGFRLPSSDEWEYACGCGSPTLFRWGDHVHCGRYPTDPGGSGDHRRPNAFGLLIASDPYKSELVTEAGVTRGGDGGGMICGGVGFFVGWLTLATAYFEDHTCRHDLAEPVTPGFTVGRRVLELC
jgi:hypothetical protein